MSDPRDTLHSMLGWHISVYRQVTNRMAPAVFESQADRRLSVWQTPEFWLAWLDDVLTDKWVGHTLTDGAVVADCRPDEWLLVEAWDES